MIATPVVKELIPIIGKDWVLEAPGDLATYSYDAFLPEFKPDAVVVPSTAEEISRIMRLANRQRIPVTPRGAGTNICGGSVAKQGGPVKAAMAWPLRHRQTKGAETDRLGLKSQ
jgi:glycolate oxidase